MAASPIDAIIDLGKKLEAAKALADREASLEQACRETEARLSSLREQESAVGAGLTDAVAESDRKIAETLASQKRSIDTLKARYDEAVAAGNEAIRVAEAETAGRLADLDEVVAARESRVAALEAEEAKLGQSVAALRADLAALRAKLG